MKQEHERKIPDVLCPFFERECPRGVGIARICWRRFNSPDHISDDYEEFEANCKIANWMFSPVNGRSY